MAQMAAAFSGHLTGTCRYATLAGVGNALLLGLLVASSTETLRADTCPFIRLDVTAAVVERENVVPVVGAKVLVFLDSEVFVSAYPPQGTGGDFAISDDRGLIRHTLWFSTDEAKRPLLGSACKRRPRQATIVVLRDGHRPQRFTKGIDWDDSLERQARAHTGVSLSLGALALQ